MHREAPAIAGFIAAHRSAISRILRTSTPSEFPEARRFSAQLGETISLDPATEVLLELACDFYRRLYPGQELDRAVLLNAVSLALRTEVARPREEFSSVSDKSFRLQALGEKQTTPAQRKNWDNLIEGCQLIDFNWRYLYLNSVAIQHARRPREELLGKTIMEAYSGIERTPVFQELRRAMEQREACRLTNDFTYPDGTQATFELVIQPVPEGIYIFSLDITEQARHEAVIQKINLRTRDLFENMMNGYTYCRMIFENGVPCDFEYLDVNHAFSMLTGLKNVIGRKITEVIPGIRETNPELLQIYGRVVETGEPVRFEIAVDFLDGWFDIVVYRPQPGHFVAMFENITPRKRTELQLRESESRFRAVAEQAADAFFLHDLEGRIIDVNRAACESLGYSRDELLQLMVTDIARDLGPDQAREIWAQIQPGTGYTGQGYHYRKDGTKFPVEARLGQVETGGRRLILGLIRDITERKASEAAIQYERDRLRLTAAAAPGVIHTFCMRPDGTNYFQYASPKISEIYGISSETLMKSGDPVRNVIHPDDISKVVETTNEALRQMTEWSCEYRVKHPTKGLIWVEGRSTPTREPDGSILWHGFLTDITERKQLEQQFLQAQKMEAVGQLAGGIAHDFNNLLTVINGYSDLLIAGDSIPEANRSTIATIREAGERAAQLTRQLLAFSRKAIVSLKVLNLNAIVSSSKILLERLIGEHIQVSLDLEPKLDQIQADAGQIDQVLMNLVVNARDAMPEGGTLTLQTRNLTLNSMAGEEHPPLKPGRYVALTVIDSGCGMTDETREHIFDPFFTTKDVGKGTGLGLSVVHGVVHQLGGHISVRSHPGQGTRFQILLPAVN